MAARSKAKSKPPADGHLDALVERFHTGTLTEQDSTELAEMLEAFRAKKRNPQPNVLEGYLTRAQLAEQLECHRNTLSRAESKGEGPPCRVIFGRALYHVDDVRDWLKEQLDYKRKAKKSAGGKTEGAKA